MNNLKAYFGSEHDVHRIILLTFSLVLFWNIENIASINFNYKKWKHAFTNGLFIITDAPIQFLFGIALIKTINWDGLHHWGALNLIPGFSNPWIELIVTFIFLDFFEYVYHIIMHKVKRFWKFHLVHHSDRVVDVSTTLREHPGETLIRLSFSVFWVFLLGASFWVILLRQFIQIASNVFVHSNFRLPDKIDRIAGLVFITPNIHHVHHHYKQPYTDSNYGDILSVWDRLFKTFRRLDIDKTQFGLDTRMDVEVNTGIKKLATIPFEKIISNK